MMTAAAPDAGAPASPSGRRLHWGRMDWSTYGLMLGIIVLWIIFDLTTGGLFLSGRNLTLLLVQGAVLGIAVCGVVYVMVAGHIDLSVGSAVGLTTTVVTYFQSQMHLNTAIAIAGVAGVGVVIGAWQGFWVAYVGVPAFIVTLGGMMFLRGLTYLITNGQTFGPTTSAFQNITAGTLGRDVSVALCVLLAAALIAGYIVSSRRGQLGTTGGASAGTGVIRYLPALLLLCLVAYIAGSYQGIPLAVIILGLLAAVLSFFANNTRYGRHLYAIGGEPEAARRAGINIRRTTFLLFVGMGLIYALDGITLASRLNGAPPDPALFLELEAITAAIIGGTSLFGGVGSISGALLGAVLLTSLDNGMELAGLSTYLQYVVEGLALTLVVALDMYLKKRRA
jgi:D-xylose transport system permease protein